MDDLYFKLPIRKEICLGCVILLIGNLLAWFSDLPIVKVVGIIGVICSLVGLAITSTRGCFYIRITKKDIEWGDKLIQQKRNFSEIKEIIYISNVQDESIFFVGLDGQKTRLDSRWRWFDKSFPKIIADRLEIATASGAVP